jgi:hypothetical protein
MVQEVNAAHYKGPVTEFVPTVREKPEDAAKKFRWAEYLKDRKFYEPQIRAFCGKYGDKLNLNPDAVTFDLDNANLLAGKIYDYLYPDQEKGLIYHNKEHAQITAVSGMKLYLGNLAHLAEDPRYAKFFRDNPAVVQKLTQITAFTLALHELDDWWITNKDVTTTQTVKNMLTGVLRENHICIDDFNRLIRLDTFSETLDESLGKYQDDKNLFLSPDPQGEPDSIFTHIPDADLVKELKFAAGASTRTADFMQIMNPGYRQKCLLTDNLGNPIAETMVGPVALAQEMRDHRPKALGFTGWALPETNPQEVDWKAVSLNDKFYQGKAKPNLDYAMKYLKNFDPDEFERASAIIDDIEFDLAAMARQQNIKTDKNLSHQFHLMDIMKRFRLKFPRLWRHPDTA